MNAKTLTLAGAVVLIIGLFLPAINAMGMGLSLLLPAGQLNAPGLILVACAVLGGILAVMGQTKWAVVPGLAALGYLVWQFLDSQNQLTGASGEIPPEAAEMMARWRPLSTILAGASWVWARS